MIHDAWKLNKALHSSTPWAQVSKYHLSQKMGILSYHCLCISVANICIIYLAWKNPWKEQDHRAPQIRTDERRWEVEPCTWLVPCSWGRSPCSSRSLLGAETQKPEKERKKTRGNKECNLVFPGVSWKKPFSLSLLAAWKCTRWSQPWKSVN